MPFYDRKTPRLRLGRISSAGAIYFITVCTKRRAPILARYGTGSRVTETLLSMHTSGDVKLTAATLMPDHAHLLFTLGERLEVGQVMGKFKTKSRDQGRAAWHWQDDGFEHRLRPTEAVEDYGFYIFMNPYRAGLCPLAAPWPWWVCPNRLSLSFLSLLAPEDAVPKEWLGRCDEIAGRIAVGDQGTATSAGPTS
jgi:putative transposase